MNIFLENQWVFLVTVFWVTALLGSCVTKDPTPFSIAAQSSVLLGLLYLLVK
jgi:hypothetical protein